MSFVMLCSLAIGHGLFCSAAAAPLGLGPDRVDASVKGGVGFLVRAQLPDGMIQEKDKRENHGVAMTALAVMGLASVGHQPVDKTTEGEALRKAVAFLLRPDVTSANGYYG